MESREVEKEGVVDETNAWVCIAGFVAAVFIVLIVTVNIEWHSEAMANAAGFQAAIKAGLCQRPSLGNGVWRWDSCDKSAAAK